MKRHTVSQDRLNIKGKKGTWLRFIKIFPKCRLPWVWLIAYILLDVGVVNLGVSETDYTAKLLAGDTSVLTVTILIALILVRLLCSNLVVYVRALTGARITRNMRGVLLEKIMRLPMSFFKQENPRDGIYRIVNNPNSVQSAIVFVMLPLFTACYTAVAVMGKVLTYDWRLSLVMLLFVPLQILNAFLFGRINFFLTKRNADLNSKLTQRLAEMVTNIPLAKAFAKEQEETEKGTEITGQLYNLTIKTSWLSQLKTLSDSAVSMLQALAICLVGYFLIGEGAIKIRGWIGFFMFSSTFGGAITSFMGYWNNIKVIQGTTDRVAEIMDAQEEDFSGEPCENLSGDLELKNVRFGYEDNKNVLNDVSCVFPDNHVTALLGVSGCGKTTLINLLARLYNQQSGSITVNGKDIHDYALRDYRNQFVIVSHDSILFSGTIRENVCYGCGNVADSDLVDVLKKVGAYDFVLEMQGGLDAKLEEYGSNLSGGQRQRLIMARALLSNAHYIILDEPVVALDALATADMMKILTEAAKDRCMIVIAHTAAILSLADRVVVIEEGSVSAQGGIAETVKESQFLRAFTQKGGFSV